MEPTAVVAIALGTPIVATIWAKKAGPAGPWRVRFVVAAMLLGLALVAALGGAPMAFTLLLGFVGAALLVLSLMTRDKQREHA